ncbi:Zinc finger RING-type domain containing protein [Klebsormidium nitens]|uniref:Zinc finger RING-type domain containing protein n=1 Tax=Klebsormidium nitens TaxID=105231 RepID=A0A0U9HSJ1_KLENI|nr:Zinc finger RING-type domain containing protein [Klebsormidium nitens]|eukprot:GAQ91743.1 Zinc finger RING-type domain containing protein [Klebsormidium nitens]
MDPSGAAENAPVGGKGTPRGARESSTGSPRRALREEDENAVNSVLLGPAAREAASGRTQYDADLALARALQEQERAYYLLREQSMAARSASDLENDAEGYAGGEGEDDIYEGGEYVPGEEGGEGSAEGAPFDDEAFARALQEAEEREAEERVMALAGMNVASDDAYGSEDEEDDWEEDGIDPDNMTYEELTALAEVVGSESKGLPAEAIARLPKSAYKATRRRRSSSSGQEQCVICRVEFEDDDVITTLPSCKHHYHSPCIEQWLSINKICPMCLTEVTPMKSRAASRRPSHLGAAKSEPSSSDSK